MVSRKAITCMRSTAMGTLRIIIVGTRRKSQLELRHYYSRAAASVKKTGIVSEMSVVIGHLIRASLPCELARARFKALIAG